MEGTCFEVSSYCVDKKYREQFDQSHKPQASKLCSSNFPCGK